MCLECEREEEEGESVLSSACIFIRTDPFTFNTHTLSYTPTIGTVPSRSKKSCRTAPPLPCCGQGAWAPEDSNGCPNKVGERFPYLHYTPTLILSTPNLPTLLFPTRSTRATASYLTSHPPYPSLPNPTLPFPTHKGQRRIPPPAARGADRRGRPTSTHKPYGRRRAQQPACRTR